MSSFAKALCILDLFQEGRISIHLDDAVQMLKTSRATAYRYFGALCDAGLLSPNSNGTYVLGPRIIELDRLMRIGDPLLTAGRRVMQDISVRYNLNMLLSSYYRDSIMCVDIAWPDASIPPNYERGKPMSLFKGAMAKIILANLSPYQLRNMALHHAEQIREAGLGEDWKAFRASMVALCKEGSSVTRAELMPDSVGVAAPIFDSEGKILGSVTFAIPVKRFDSSEEVLWRQLIVDAGARITSEIARESDASKSSQISSRNNNKKTDKSPAPSTTVKLTRISARRSKSTLTKGSS